MLRCKYVFSFVYTEGFCASIICCPCSALVNATRPKGRQGAHFSEPPYCYFTFYIYLINFYIHPRSSSTQDMYSEQYGSHLKISHVLLFVITECMELKFKASQCLQFVTIGHTVQKFKCYRQTYKQYGDVKSLHSIECSFP
jgi:hypothetical protein